MANPFSYDYGDYDFESAKKFSNEYLSKFNLAPSLK